MQLRWKIVPVIIIIGLILSCTKNDNKKKIMKSKSNLAAKDILGNPEYQAISYGGYRESSRNIQPSVEELKEDMKLLSVMGIKILRTYNVQLAHASNVLKAIKELKEEQVGFEMYVMLGAWIDCKNAWTEFEPDHNVESEQNQHEIARAVALANQYPDIVKVIAVGNEAMVKWAASYFVQPEVILKWVNHLQGLKTTGELSKDLWITSSDNFASWGGGDHEYHVEDLNNLIKAVDYISMHTYPMHDTHYNPVFWGTLQSEDTLLAQQKIKKAMQRTIAYADGQYESVKAYMRSIGVDKPIHIGETGWATSANGHYGPNGSSATDEYKEALYYEMMREWSKKEKMSCFYFQAFDEPWKDAQNPGGSENYFGLFTVDGQAKYVLWPLVDQGVFDGLTRGGNPITKTYDGNAEELLKVVSMPPQKEELMMAD